MEWSEFLVHSSVTAEILDGWIAAGWLAPRRLDGGHEFTEVDVARARLIHDLQHRLGVNDEGIPVILDLLDQTHGLRRAMREVMAALAAQPETTRRTIVAEIQAIRATPIPRAGG